jgi:hypothetical protein
MFDAFVITEKLMRIVIPFHDGRQGLTALVADFQTFVGDVEQLLKSCAFAGR